MNRLQQIIYAEMNKTLLPDDIGYSVGLVNNAQIVEKMSLLILLKHNFRILIRYKFCQDRG